MSPTSTPREGRRSADEPTVYTNATVVTCDAANTIAEAVAVDDSRIAAVGAAEEVRRAAGRRAVVVDLDGATVLPAFIDTHPHLMHFGVIAEPLVDLGDAVDLADIAARITAHAANIPAGQWDMATPVGEPHYFPRRSYRNLTEGQLLDRTVLDAAAPNHPSSFRRGRRSFRTPASSTLRASDDSASPTTPPTESATSGSKKTPPANRPDDSTARSRCTTTTTTTTK